MLRVDRARLFTRAEPLTGDESAAFGEAAYRRCGHVPLQHITGEQWFMSLRLEVHPGVFIPRPETEVLAEAALEAIAGQRSPVVVDVGTGSGAVGLWIKHERRDAFVVATDISPEAVELARRNAEALGLEMTVVGGSMLDEVAFGLKGSVALLVSNPPYLTGEEYEAVAEEVVADPTTALVGGTTVHAALVEASAGWLAPGGALITEIGATQGDEVAGIFRGRLRDVRILKDLAGRDRVVEGRLP